MAEDKETKNFRNINEDNLVDYCYFWNSNKNNLQVDSFLQDINLTKTKNKIKNYFSQNTMTKQSDDVAMIIKNKITELFSDWINKSLIKEKAFINDFLPNKQIIDINKKLQNSDLNSTANTEWNNYYQAIDNSFQTRISNKNNNIATLIELFYNKEFIQKLSEVKTSRINSTSIGKYIKSLINLQDNSTIQNFVNTDLQKSLLANRDSDEKDTGLKVIENFFDILEKLDDTKEETTITTIYTINQRGINFITQQIQESANEILSKNNDNIENLVKNIDFGSYELEGKNAEKTNKKALQHFIRYIYTKIGEQMNNSEFNSLITKKGIGAKGEDSLFVIYKDFSEVQGGWGKKVNAKIKQQKNLQQIVTIVNDFIINKAKDFCKNLGYKIALTNNEEQILKKYIEEILEDTDNAQKVLMVYNLQGVSGVMGEIAAAIKLKLILNSNDELNKIKITGSEENKSGQVGYDVLLTSKNSSKVIKEKYGFQVKNYISKETSITVYDKTSIKLKEPEALSKYIKMDEQKVMRFLLCNCDLFNKINSNELNLLVKDINLKNLEYSLFYFIKSFLRINDMTVIGKDLDRDIRDTTEVNFWFLNNRIAPSSYILYMKYQQLCKFLNSTNKKNIYGYFSKSNTRLNDFPNYETHNSKQINAKNYPHTTLETDLLSNVRLNVSGISIPITFPI